MHFVGEFKTIQGDIIKVDFTKPAQSSATIPITLGAAPCIIEQKSDGLFSPIKSRSATIEIVSNDYIFELYTPLSRGVKVLITNETTESVLFRGFVVPNVYDQTYTYLDTISIECVDAVSTLKDFRYQTLESAPIYRSMTSYILDFLKECEYDGSLYVAEAYSSLNSTPVTGAIVDSLCVSEGNFFDDDEEHTPATKYDMLEEMLRFLGLTLLIDGDDVWIYNYRLKTNSDTYSKYSISTGLRISINYSFDHTRSPLPYAGGTSNLSLDAVFNKIEISDNLYPISEISPDIFDENTHISVTDESGMGPNGAKWVRHQVKRHWLRPNEIINEIQGYQYQIFCRLRPESGWKHHYYRHQTKVEVDSYHDPNSFSQYTSNEVNRVINTHGALIQHYSYRENNGPNLIPTSLDWEEYITFFVTDDTTPTITLANVRNLELPVLEYEVDEQVNFKPSTGCSWLVIKGSLYYQYDGAKFGEKNRDTLRIVDTEGKIYQTAPVDKATDIGESMLVSLYRSYDYQQSTYGTGFKTWKMKLQVGDKFWNGRSWTSTESTFYISYNNAPENRENEFISAFKWMDPVPNVDYTDKVGEDGYCIPIDSNDSNAPSFGKMKLTIYTPDIIPSELSDMFVSIFGDVPLSWNSVPNVVYCKGFSLDYIYTDSDVWYSQKKDASNTDVVYTNLINESYTNEFDSLELKINTQLPDRPISRSYVSTNDMGYLYSLKHISGDVEKTQEKNVIDLYYYHYNNPKVRYSCNLRAVPTPYHRYSFKNTDPITDTTNGEGFILDSYSWDVLYNNLRAELVLY